MVLRDLYGILVVIVELNIMTCFLKQIPEDEYSDLKTCHNMCHWVDTTLVIISLSTYNVWYLTDEVSGSCDSSGTRRMML